MTANVVIGYDGSDGARDALALGRVLGEALDAELIVAGSYGDEALLRSSLLVPERRWLREEALRTLAGAAAVLPDVEHWHAEPILSPSAARGLLDVAAAHRTLAIVVGSSRLGVVGSVLPGSVGERLLSGAPCPVAIAPVGFNETSLRSIGAAYDGSREARRALTAAAALARGAGASLELLNVLDPPNPANPLFAVSSHGYHAILDDLRAMRRSDLARAARWIVDGLEVESRLLEGPVAATLVRQSERLDALVLGSRGYGPLRRVALGGVSAEVVRHARCPVIVVPRGAAGGLANGDGAGLSAHGRAALPSVAGRWR